LLAQEEVTKKKGLLRGALRSVRCSGCVEGWPGFSTGHPAPIEKAGTSLSAFGGLIVQPSPPRREPGKSKSSQIEPHGSYFLLASVHHFSFSPPGRRRDEGRVLEKALLQASVSRLGLRQAFNDALRPAPHPNPLPGGERELIAEGGV
jgi:hypothetical protein